MVIGATEPAEVRQLLISRLKVRFLPRLPSNLKQHTELLLARLQFLERTVFVVTGFGDHFSISEFLKRSLNPGTISARTLRSYLLHGHLERNVVAQATGCRGNRHGIGAGWRSRGSRGRSRRRRTPTT